MTTLIHLLFITFIIAVTIIISIFIYRDTKQTEAKLKEHKKQQKKFNNCYFKLKSYKDYCVTDNEMLLPVISEFLSFLKLPKYTLSLNKELAILNINSIIINKLKLYFNDDGMICFWFDFYPRYYTQVSAEEHLNKTIALVKNYISAKYAVNNKDYKKYYLQELDNFDKDKFLKEISPIHDLINEYCCCNDDD